MTDMATAAQQQIAETVVSAREAIGMSRRGLAEQAGIPLTTLKRIEDGLRAASMPEIVAISYATGVTVGSLTGSSPVLARAKFSARGTNGSGMQEMRRRLSAFLELDAYLDSLGVPDSE